MSKFTERFQQRQSLIERIMLYVAFASGVAGCITAFLTIAFYIPDRDERIRQQLLDNQMKVAGIYFDKYHNSSDLCGNKEKAISFAKIAGQMVNIDAKQLDEYLKGVEMPLIETDKYYGLKKIVLVISDDIKRTNTDKCEVNPSLDASLSNAQVKVAAAVANPEPYIAPVAAPLAAQSRFIVYIQYGDGAEGPDRAKTMREQVKNMPNLSVPVIEKVAQTIRKDQIRVFGPRGQEEAVKLKAALNLTDAEIIDLSKLYRNATDKNLEIWLKTQ